MRSRIDANSGSFYPDNEEDLVKLIEHFNTILKNYPQKLSTLKNRILISPHAGYIYSGFSANCGYHSIKDDNFKKVVVIGPSHRVVFDGVSIADFDNYKTPLGDINIDIDLLNSLKSKFNLNCKNEAHFEHSTETQMPFLKYYLGGNFKVTELIYSNCELDLLVEIVSYLATFENLLIVISTDLSHFHTLKEAKYIDSHCVNAIDKLDFSSLQRCEACGILGVVASLIYAKNSSLSTQVLDYRTSADTSNDINRVVGYLSAIIGK